MEDKIEEIETADGSFTHPWNLEELREHGCADYPPYYNMYTISLQSIPIGEFIRGPSHRIFIGNSKKGSNERKT